MHLSIHVVVSLVGLLTVVMMMMMLIIMLDVLLNRVAVVAKKYH